MEILKLALEAGLPLIHIRTDDIINVEQVLTFLAAKPVKPISIPTEIVKQSDLKNPDGDVFYTSSDCKSLAKLYHWAVDNEKTVVFVNTEKSVIQFDGGNMVPPKELVYNFLSEISENPDELLPSFGGMTLKDVGEVAKMTMTRDQKLTPQGVNTTRRGYNKLRGITQVDTVMPYYVCPSYLTKWLGDNKNFYINPVHPSLIPRGALFDGPPGTGKTLAGKLIATTFGVPLYRLDLGAMMGKYVGESENNLNSALAQIDQVEPCVVILDEVEKLFKGQGDSGVTSRLLSQLLWWLQEHQTKVFTVMTTNDIEVIPEELYRPGRIDVVMNFEGIESYGEGVPFAKGSFDAMLTQLSATSDEDSYKELNKRVKSLFNDGAAVPQTKLVQVANDLVREMITAAQQDDEAVGNSDLPVTHFVASTPSVGGNDLVMEAGTLIASSDHTAEAA